MPRPRHALVHTLLLPVLTLLLPVLLAARAASATVAADVPCAAGSPPPGPCVLESTAAVSDGSLLDFGARALVLTATGTLNAGGGTMTIRAGALTLQPGGVLASPGGYIVVETPGAIDVQGGARSIDASNEPGGGSILLTADGDVQIAGGVLARGSNTFADGGYIEISGNAVTVADTGNLRAPGGQHGFGGLVDVIAIGPFTLNGHALVDVGAGDSGGGIAIDAGEVVAGPDSGLDASSGVAGFGASVEITTSGNVSLAGTITGTASGDLTVGGGGGADVLVSAGGTLTLNGIIRLSVNGPEGYGGAAELEAEGAIVQPPGGHILADATGANGFGGEITVVSSSGGITLHDIDAQGTGAGGVITVEATAGVTIPGTLRADGPSGGVDIYGCDVSVPAGALLSSDGPEALNQLTATGQLVIGGALSAQDGTNRLDYRDAGSLQVEPTASIDPAAVETINTNLPPCDAASTTTTSTTSSTTATTATTTSSTSTTVTVPATTTTTTTVTPSTSLPSTTVTTSSLPAASTTTTTLAPTPACVAGAAQLCDDGDGCTLDRCDPLLGCESTPVTGIDAVTCRLAAIRALIVTAPLGDVGGARAQGRLTRRIDKIVKLVDGARGAPAKRARTKLGRANRRLAAFTRSVVKAAAKRTMAAALSAQITNLASEATAQLQPLLPS